MKKFLLVSFLCITPLFVSHAADLTVEDCANYIEYWEDSSSESFNLLPELIQDFFKYKENIKQWSIDDPYQDADLDLFITCQELDIEEPAENIAVQLKKHTLTLKKALADYETLETRKRIPFVRHGNVLPGPTADEDGSFYVEQKFIPKFVNGSLIFLMSLSILMVIVGGLMFLFSSGDSELTSRAKTTILWAIVGVVLTILAYAIVQFIIGIDFSLQ